MKDPHERALKVLGDYVSPAVAEHILKRFEECGLVIECVALTDLERKALEAERRQIVEGGTARDPFGMRRNRVIEIDNLLRVPHVPFADAENERVQRLGDGV
jgi:hypothetical protein